MQRSWYVKVLVCKGLGMQRSPFALSPDDFIHISHIRYTYLFRKPLRGLCRWGHLRTLRVCKGPPLHQVPMIILISFRLGKLVSLESLYEACVRVCKGPPLHYLPMITLISLRQSMLTFLESLYEACADGDIYSPRYLHTRIYFTT